MPALKLRRKLLLAAGAAIASLLALEVAARIALRDEFVQGELTDPGWAACARYDPWFGWTSRPGARVHVLEPRPGYHVRIGSRGFRDRERAQQPASGTQRVVFLGDSMTWGWGVEEEERFTNVLESRLGVEMLNLGVPGYGTDQELWLLEEQGLALAPDVVVVGFVLNDVTDAEHKVRHRMFKPCYVREADGSWTVGNRPAPPPQGRLASFSREVGLELRAQSALAAWIRRTRDEAPPAFRPTSMGREEMNGYCDKLTDPDSVTTMLFAKLAAACARSRCALLVFSMPHNHDVHLYQAAAQRPDAGEPVESRLSRRLAEAGGRHGFRTVSVDAALFAAASSGVDLDSGDGHYNREGHRVVAAALEPTLRGLLEEVRAK